MSDTTAPVSAKTFRSREARPYWEGLEQGLVKYQYCTACDQAIFYPRTFCPYCMNSHSIEWRTSTGRGKIYTFSELFVPPTEAERSRVPYVLGIVEMEEGFYLFGEIVGPREHLAVDASVEGCIVSRNQVKQLNFSIQVT